MGRIELFKQYYVPVINVYFMATYQFGNGSYAVKFTTVFGDRIGKEVKLNRETIADLTDTLHFIVSNHDHLLFLIKSVKR